MGGLVDVLGEGLKSWCYLAGILLHGLASCIVVVELALDLLLGFVLDFLEKGEDYVLFGCEVLDILVLEGLYLLLVVLGVLD